jgi:AraC-like DNA-binding protein
MKSDYQVIQQILEEYQMQLNQNTYPPLNPSIKMKLCRVEQFAEKEVSPQVLCTMEYIHNHLFDRKLTIAYLKQNCNITGKNFSTAFAYYIGRTPKKYINLLRVDAATRLLQEKELSDTPLSRIAASVGYNRPSTFSKAFKRVTGHTPGEWRQNQLQ